jgi:hypothetical protein
VNALKKPFRNDEKTVGRMVLLKALALLKCGLHKRLSAKSLIYYRTGLPQNLPKSSYKLEIRN